MHYELCDCPREAGVLTICGCGAKHLGKMGDDIIHWHGKHWELECAFKEALYFLDILDPNGYCFQE